MNPMQMLLKLEKGVINICEETQLQIGSEKATDNCQKDQQKSVRAVA